jgi:hypothetical protein
MKIRKYIIYFLAVWLFIWENSKKDWPWDFKLRIFKFPEFFNMLEVAVILFSLLLIIYEKKFSSKFKIQPKKIFILIKISLLFTLFSWFINGSLKGNMFSGDYIKAIAHYYSPFFIYIVVYNLANDVPEIIDKLNKIILVFVSLNILIAWYQIVLLNAKYDFVTGFSRNAHNFALILMIFSAFLFFIFIKRKNPIYIIYILISFIPVIFASYGKAFVAFIAAIFVFTVLELKLNIKKIVVSSISSIIILYAILGLLKKIDYDSYTKIDIVLSTNLTNMPLIKSFIKIPFFITENLKNAFLGFGPGQFGSGVHMKPEKDFRGFVYSPEMMDIYDYIGSSYGDGIVKVTVQTQMPTSCFLAILFEHGLIVLTLFYYILYRLYKKTIRISNNYTSGKRDYMVNSIQLLILFFTIFSIFLPDLKPFEAPIFTLGFVYIALLHKKYDVLKHNMSSNKSMSNRMKNFVPTVP